MPDLSVGMSLRELIAELQDLSATEGDQIEVVSIAEDGEMFTPVICVGPSRDGVRRVSI
jgi:hypothetical protein